MGDTLITVIAIFLTAVLMFVFPLMSLSARNDNITQISVQTVTSEFVDKISTKGILTKEDYETYLKDLASTGNTYDVTLEMQILDDTSNKLTTTSGDLIGENARYSIYTTTIVDDYLYNSEKNNEYKLQQGDVFIVTATNTNTTTAQTIRNFIYTMVGKDTYKISAKSASMVVHGTKKVTIPLGESEGTELTPPKPEPEKKLIGITITKDPTKKEYRVGEDFEQAGMVVQANYAYEGQYLPLTEEITDYTIQSGTNLKYGRTFITVSYLNATAIQLITVVDEGMFTYDETDSGIRITKVNSDGNKNIIIPSTIQGKTVTSIGGSVLGLNGSLNIINVVIPEGVVTIEDYAFISCTRLTNIVIPSSVKTIGVSAFQSCHALKSIEVPEGVLEIGALAFSGCKLLNEVTIPKSVTSIGKGAFRACESLKTVNIDDENENYANYGGIVFSKDKTQIVFYPPKKEGSSYAIPSGVKEIVGGAFSFSNLQSIVIPDGVTRIGSSAFEDCLNLTNIKIPEGVVTIEDNAFTDCYNLNKAEIPSSLKSIGRYAFSFCKSLTNIEIPNGVNAIGNYAFYRCTNLKSITIPASVTWIASYAFFDSSIETIKVPNTITVPDNKWGASNAIIEVYTP